jgi:hypothetical protein
MSQHSNRVFPSPWTVKHIAGGFEVLDANGQSLAHVYGRETQADADTAAMPTMDEAREIANNIAMVPTVLALKDAFRFCLKVFAFVFGILIAAALAAHVIS